MDKLEEEILHRNGERRKILFVVNPISGGIDKSSLPDQLKEFNETHQQDFRLFYTSESSSTNDLLQEISAYKPDIVAAIGGDGTCNFAAGGILNTGIALAIIPLGSANGLATELAIPKNLNDSLNLMISGKIKLIDTIWINKKLCLHISDTGLNARIIKRFEEDKIRGFWSYIRHFLKEIRDTKPFKFTLITEEGKKITKKAQVVAIANARKYGSGAMINPVGVIDDGKFELVIIKPYTFFGFFSIAAAIFLGYLDKVKYVEIKSYRKITLLKNKKQPLHIDGEIIENSNEIKAMINPSSLRVIVPIE